MTFKNNNRDTDPACVCTCQRDTDPPYVCTCQRDTDPAGGRTFQLSHTTDRSAHAPSLPSVSSDTRDIFRG